MRIKIIAVNALVVALVGVLSFLLVRGSLGTAAGNKDELFAQAQDSVSGAAAQLQLQGLLTERWITPAANDPASAEALSKATATARGDAASKRCDDLVSRMKNAPLFERNVPTLVALVDTSGHIVGRNNSNMGRGEDLAGTYAGLKAALASGQPGSDVWYEKDRYLASYAPVHDDQGKVIGALVVGLPLNDTLSRVSGSASGRPLVVAVPNRAGGFDVVAHSAQQLQALDESVGGAAKGTLANALSHQQTDVVRDGDLLVAAAPLSSLEDGKRALLVVSSPASLIQDPGGLALAPIFGATALGLVLVVIGGWLLGNYVTGPIDMLEEGLLAILNGQTDRRFELDHAELGGLAFRIDQLLNKLMGVEEDTTDAEGRVSVPSRPFTDALEVDPRRMHQSPGEGTLDPEAIRRLAAEPPAQYYGRLYREYVAAKKAIGESADHVSEQAFAARMQSMEVDAAQKYGRPVRYQVQARGHEVVLVAVPL
jgi:hypothetical protein